MAGQVECQTDSSPINDDEPDPRVQIELERLNHAAEAINHLELQLDEARKTFQEYQEGSEMELAQLEKKIGSAVSKARNYYDARLKLRDAKETLTKAKHRFERAQALHVAAKELALVSADYIDEAEKSHSNAATWNETYRHAIVQAADAEREKFLADLEQQRAQQIYSEIEALVEKLEKDFRRSINKSKPYYEMKAEYHKEFDFQKRKVFGLENCVQEAKGQYQQSLRNLERISNEIHEQRNQSKTRRELGERTSGVGEEQKAPPLPNNDKRPSISHSDSVLRSCLLRTETLPAGIFINPPERLSPEGDETADQYLHDQFILRPKAPSSPTLVKIPSNSSPLRSSSFSSHLTNDDDDDHSNDTTESLHVLSDEQLNNLAAAYHSPYPTEKPDSDPIDEILLQIQHSTDQAKTFFRKLFKAPNDDE